MRKRYTKLSTRKVFDEVVRRAKDTLRADGEHPPTVMAVCGQEAVIVPMFAEVNSQKEKMRQMYSAGFLAASSGKIKRLEQVFFIAEAWITVQSEQKSGMSHAQAPHRKEVLMISSHDVWNKRSQIDMYEIFKDKAGKLSDLRKWEHSNFDELSHIKSPLIAAFVDGYYSGQEKLVN